MQMGSRVLNKCLCEPTRRHRVFTPPPPQNKASCFIQGYYKGYGSNTHERQYVLEYEEETDTDCND